MKKLILFFASLCLVPTLLFANNCEKLTDEQYREALIQHPLAMNLTLNDMNWSLTLAFSENSEFTEHFEGFTPMGIAVMDFKGTWAVNDAILTTHFTEGSYQETSNADMNSALEKIKQYVLSMPERHISLDQCGEMGSVANGLLMN